MKTKKLLYVVVAVIIFIALALGATLARGFAAVVIVIALLLHVFGSVYGIGHNWEERKVIKMQSDINGKGAIAEDNKRLEPDSHVKMDER